MNACRHTEHTTLIALAFASSWEFATALSFRFRDRTLECESYDALVWSTVPIAFSLIPPCHGKSEGKKFSLRMSTEGYLHDFTRDLIKSRLSKTPVTHEVKPIPGHPKLIHRPNVSTASTAVSVNVHSAITNIVVADDLQRIKFGTERRTTLMIKRVPRKYVPQEYSSHVKF
jgi:hypothetical protein